MNVISDSIHTGIVSGQVLFDGKPGTARDCVAMVPERDLHIRELTVYENLYYSSLLRPRKPFSADTHITINRQPSDGSGDEEATPPNAIERATMSLGVDHLLDTVVGEGLSPGELRLLTIATEMLDLPAVLLFDDLFVGEYLSSSVIDNS